MGSCFSSASFADNLPKEMANCADVVSVSGDLHNYSIPITVSQVLESEEAISSAAAAAAHNFFLCNSDCLYLDDYIPALAPHDQLEPSQLYFLLPLPKLRSRLTVSDMAALAVKASLALQMTCASRNYYHEPPRISPAPRDHDHHEDQPNRSHLQVINGSTQKAQGVNSRRRRPKHYYNEMAAAVPSFRTTTLPTISEGSVLLSSN